MAVPKAPMNEHRFTVSRQNNVGASGQPLGTKTETIALCMDQASDQLLWGRVLTPNAGHDFTAFFPRKLIRH